VMREQARRPSHADSGGRPAMGSTGLGVPDDYNRCPHATRPAPRLRRAGLAASKLPVPSRRIALSLPALAIHRQGHASYDLTDIVSGRLSMAWMPRVDGMVYASIALPRVSAER